MSGETSGVLVFTKQGPSATDWRLPGPAAAGRRAIASCGQAARHTPQPKQRAGVDVHLAQGRGVELWRRTGTGSCTPCSRCTGPNPPGRRTRRGRSLRPALARCTAVGAAVAVAVAQADHVGRHAGPDAVHQSFLVVVAEDALGLLPYPALPGTRRRPGTCPARPSGPSQSRSSSACRSSRWIGSGSRRACG